MSISVHKPNDPITNLSLTEIAGNLPADTYKIRLSVLGTNTDVSLARGAQQRSPPTVEETIVLSSTGGIQMDWTNPTDGKNKAILCWIYSNSEGRWLYYNGEGVDGIDSALTTYDIIDWSGYKYFGFAWATDGSSPVPAFPHGLNAELGVGQVEITGDAGSLDGKDIVDAIKAAYGGSLPDNAYYNDMGSFWGWWGIKSTSATSGSLNLTYWEFWLMGGLENGDSFNIYTLAQKLNLQSISSPMQGGSTLYVYPGLCDFNNLILGDGTRGMDLDYYQHTQIVSIPDTKFTDCIFNCSFPRIDYPETFDNCIFNASAVILHVVDVGYEEIHVKRGIVTTGEVRYTHSINTRSDITLFNWRIDKGDYQIDIRNNRADFAYHLNLVDCSFPNTDSGYDYIPILKYTTYENNFTDINIQSEIDLRVVDNNGNGITGATVEMIDKDGASVISETTDGNGDIPTQYITHHTISYIEGSGNGYVGTNQINDLNPFTLTISKSGYNDIVKTFTLDSKKAEVEKLSPDGTNIQDAVLHDTVIY